MKRTIKLILLILVLLLPLTGCNKTEEVLKGYKLPPEREEGTKVELVVHETYTDEEHEVFQNIIDMFTAENPEITITVERAPKGAQWSRLTQALATRETPDIARVDMEYIVTLADTGAILPLDILLEAGELDDHIQGAILSNTYENKVWGIADQVHTNVLFYNKTLLKNAEVNVPDSQWIWNDLVETSKNIKNKNPEILGYAFESTLWETLPYLGSYGAELFDNNAISTLDSPEALKALGFLYQHQMDVGGWTQEQLGAQQLFLDGKAAMMLSGPWSIPEIESSEIDYGLAVVPQGIAGSVSNIDGTSMVIFRDTKHPRESYEFLKFLTSSEIQTLWANKLGLIPVNKASFKDVDLERHPHLEVFMKQIATVLPRPTLTNYGQVEEIFNTELASALKGEKTLQQALMDMENEMNKNKTSK